MLLVSGEGLLHACISSYLSTRYTSNAQKRHDKCMLMHCQTTAILNTVILWCIHIKAYTVPLQESRFVNGLGAVFELHLRTSLYKGKLFSPQMLDTSLVFHS